MTVSLGGLASQVRGDRTVDASSSPNSAPVGSLEWLLQYIGGFGDLTIVEEAIGRVLTTIDVQMGEINATSFAHGAHVATAWLGQGESARRLAHHHARAHAVVVDTLTGVRDDLERFRDAIREAKNLVLDADADAKQRLDSVLGRTEGIQFGQGSRDQAEVDHANDTPSVIPETPAAGATPEGTAGGTP